MAPPRQRPAVGNAIIDDSRSEASSGTATGHQSRGVPGPKPRKPAATSAAASAAAPGTTTSKELKLAAATGAAAAAASALVAGGAGAGAGIFGQNGVEYADGMRDDLPGIPWPQMPLSILHDYRHAYKLSAPSAYARPISKMLFSSGIGLRSPTAIAARKASSSSSSSSSSITSSSLSTTSGSHRNHRTITSAAAATVSASSGRQKDRILHKITSQDRIGKDQLALAVRKHFNAAGLVEQDAIARFLYKVREEGKGREFRLRFQP